MIENTSSDSDCYSILKQVELTVYKQWETHQNAGLDKLHPSILSREYKIELPRRFRELRALSIAVWYLPENLKWFILMELQELKPYLDFDNEGLDHSVTLNILSSKQRNMENFVAFRINSRELFGTILREDLEKALQNLKIRRRTFKSPRRKIRRKGYQDHGTWSPPHRRKERFDFTFIEEQNEKEDKILLIKSSTSDLIGILEEERRKQ